MTNLYVEKLKELREELRYGSLEAAHTLCAEMWNEIAENDYAHKNYTIVSLFTGLKADCAYCDYSFSHHIRNCMNNRCPLYYMDNCYLYSKWAVSETREEKRMYAIAIADVACSAE